MSDNAGALFKAEFSKMTPQLQAALPPHIKVERFARIVLTAVQENPKLLECERQSVLRSCLRCAQDGLLPDGREAALVHFWNSKLNQLIAQYMPMYQGLLKKVRNSGELASIVTHVVYTGDKFRYVLGDEEKIEHEPCDDDAKRGTPRCVYAIARLKDGSIVREVMSKAEVEKVRMSSKMKDGAPWTDWWDQQARKTVLKRLVKWLPSSTDREQDDTQRVIDQDNEEFDTSRQIEQNGTAQAAQAQTITPLPAVQSTQPALTLPPDPIARTQTRTAEVTQQIRKNTQTAPVAQQTQPAPVQQAAATTPTASVPVEEQWGSGDETTAQAGQDLEFPASELHKNSIHQPATQTVAAPAAEEPKKRKPRGGFAREGLSGDVKKVGGDPAPASNTASVNASVQQAAVMQTAPVSQPAPAAAQPVVNDGVENVDSAVVTIESGFQIRNEKQEVTGFKFVTNHADVYYTNEFVMASQIKSQFMLPKLPCLLWYVTGADKRPMIQKVEPAPKE